MSVGAVAAAPMSAATDSMPASPFTPKDAASIVPASPTSRPGAHERLMDLRWSSSRSPGKLPSLSDIAARLNVDKELFAEDGTPLSPSKSSSAEGRPRLEVTGRLIHTSIPSSPAKDASRTPAASVLGLASPSKLNTSAIGLASGSSSPTKRFSASGLPSLDEIRERMAKKGLTADNSSHPNTPTTAATGEKENTNLSAASPSSALLKFGAGPFESETKKRRSSPPPAIMIPGKDTPLIKDESIMRLGPSTPLPEKPVSPNRGNGSEPVKTERAILKPGTGSLPPTPSAAVANFALSVSTPPLQPKVHPLQHVWTLYFDSKTFNPSSAATTPKSATFPDSGQGSSSDPPATPTVSGASWEANLKCLGAYRTVEAFFSTFKTLRRPSQLDKSSNYHIFKDGIKPMWEDPCNAEGGKWIITFKQLNPGLTDRSWMWLVLGLVGEELDEHNEVTGAVCSLRPRGDRIAVWLRSKSDVERVNRIGRKALQLLELEREPGVTLEFSSNTGKPLENPSRFISVQNPTSSSGSAGPSSLGNNARRQSFQNGMANLPFGQPQRSPQPMPNGTLQQQQQGGLGLMPRSPVREMSERRGSHPLPRNPSPNSGTLASSLGVQLSTSPSKQSGENGSGAGLQCSPAITNGGGGSRFGPPLSAIGGVATGRTPLVRTGSTLNPNLPIKVQSERMAT